MFTQIKNIQRSILLNKYSSTGVKKWFMSVHMTIFAIEKKNVTLRHFNPNKHA